MGVLITPKPPARHTAQATATATLSFCKSTLFSVQSDHLTSERRLECWLMEIFRLIFGELLDTCLHVTLLTHTHTLTHHVFSMLSN